MTHTLKVGCYGAKGSYTYEAMEQQFAGKEREESYFPLFEDVVKAVKDGTIAESRLDESVRRILECKERYNVITFG